MACTRPAAARSSPSTSARPRPKRSGRAFLRGLVKRGLVGVPARHQRRPCRPKGRDREGSGLRLAALHGPLPARLLRARPQGPTRPARCSDPADLRLRLASRRPATGSQKPSRTSTGASAGSRRLLEDAEARHPRLLRVSGLALAQAPQHQPARTLQQRSRPTHRRRRHLPRRPQPDPPRRHDLHRPTVAPFLRALGPAGQDGTTEALSHAMSNGDSIAHAGGESSVSRSGRGAAASAALGRSRAGGRADSLTFLSTDPGLTLGMSCRPPPVRGSPA